MNPLRHVFFEDLDLSQSFQQTPASGWMRSFCPPIPGSATDVRLPSLDSDDSDDDCYDPGSLAAQHARRTRPNKNNDVDNRLSSRRYNDDDSDNDDHGNMPPTASGAGVENSRIFTQEEIEDLTYKRFREEMEEVLLASVSVSVGDMRQLFEDKAPLEAPEADLVPPAQAFEKVLSLFELPYEEAQKEYLAAIESQVSPAFVEAVPEILDYFKSKEVMAVFVAEYWGGITGVPPLQLPVKKDIPARITCHARPINPRLEETFRKEWARLCEYLFVPSTSPYASPIVCAYKATGCKLRICGDYSRINNWFEVSNEYIPYPRAALQKAQGWPLYVDIDMANSYHQFLLHPETRRLLAVQTPEGLFEPAFLPEGVSPASQVLQKAVREIFHDFIAEGWLIVIFDNFLAGGSDYPDLFAKIKRIIQRCAERNIKLKFSKSFFGFTEVKFFGYRVADGKVSIDDKRKEQIDKLPMPVTQKLMRSYLGMANFCSPFVPKYTEAFAPYTSLLKQPLSGLQRQSPPRWSSPLSARKLLYNAVWSFSSRTTRCRGIYKRMHP
jgi:hypothetical protein